MFLRDYITAILQPRYKRVSLQVRVLSPPWKPRRYSSKRRDSRFRVVTAQEGRPKLRGERGSPARLASSSKKELDCPMNRNDLISRLTRSLRLSLSNTRVEILGEQSSEWIGVLRFSRSRRGVPSVSGRIRQDRQTLESHFEWKRHER